MQAFGRRVAWAAYAVAALLLITVALPFRSFQTWLILLMLACIVGPYALKVPPVRRRDWVALTIVLTFLMWVLGTLDVPLRS